MIKMAFIPARYAATRFPYKLMQYIGDRTVIQHTYDNTVATGLFDDVIVVTDHAIIENEIKNNGGKCIRSNKEHNSGSDRIAEVVQDMNVDVVVNVQGDEPFVDADMLRSLLAVFEGEQGKEVQVASLKKEIKNAALLSDPNYVKLVCDQYENALYFSRSNIPFVRNQNMSVASWEHVGVYAYRKAALLNFTTWPAGILEQAEMLEQLRYLEHGMKIKMVQTDVETVKIDVPEDLAKAILFYEKNFGKM